jgi:hypothetical protein
MPTKDRQGAGRYAEVARFFYRPDGRERLRQLIAIQVLCCRHCQVLYVRVS